MSAEKGDISIAQTEAFVNMMIRVAKTMNSGEPAEGSKVDLYIAAYAVAGKKEDGKSVVYGKQVSNIATTTIE